MKTRIVKNLVLISFILSGILVYRADLGLAQPGYGRVGAANDPAIRHASAYVLIKIDADLETLNHLERAAEPLFDDWYRVEVRAAEVPITVVEQLVEIPGVAVAELEYVAQVDADSEFSAGTQLWREKVLAPVFTPNDPRYPEQWHFSAVHAPAAWDLSTGSGVTVAVLDSGVSQGADLACQTFVGEYNAVTGATGSGAAADTNGHGTHVAGTVAQCTSNGLGVAGLAFDAALMPIKVSDASGAIPFGAVAMGVYWAVGNGADVINMSLGVQCSDTWPTCSSSMLDDAMAYAVREDVVLVAATGNEGTNVISYPANHPNVIAVGAVDRNLDHTWYSNTGCGISVTAPGGDTAADSDNNGHGDGVLQETIQGGVWDYYYFQGTSMASPHVAGAAALLRAHVPAAGAPEIQAALENTAQDRGASGFDPVYGYGVIHVFDALKALQAGVTPNPYPSNCGDLPLPTPTPGPAPPAIPDLSIPALDQSGVTSHPQSLAVSGNMTVWLRNGGSANAGAFEVTVFEDLDGDGFYTAGTDNALGLANHPGLAQNGLDQISVPLSATVQFRDTQLHACTDTQGVVGELDETNNCNRTEPVCVFKAPIQIDPVLEWEWTGVSSPLPSFNQVIMTPAVADLTNDGIPEIVFVSYEGINQSDGILRAIHGDNGSNFFSITDPSLRLCGICGIAIGDIDLDSKPDILAMNYAKKQVIAFDQDGTHKWTSNVQMGFMHRPTPALADLNRDGVPEIIVAYTVLDNSGNLVWSDSQPTSILGSSIVVDLDLQGNPEIINGNTAYRSDGSVYWSLPQYTVPGAGAYTAVANLDLDSFPEIVMVRGGGGTVPPEHMTLLEHDGTTVWDMSLPNSNEAFLPVIADLDGDGQSEIGVANVSSYCGYEVNGTVMWCLPVHDTAAAGSTAFDFDQDGAWEIIHADEQRIRIIRGSDGVVIWETSRPSYTAVEYPVVADVDGDNRAEIVIGHNRTSLGEPGIQVYKNHNDDWPQTSGVWNQHSYHITNIYDDLSVPPNEANSWEVQNTYFVNLQDAPSTLSLVDFTASYLQLNTSGFPTSVEITVRIGNGGAEAPTGPVSAAFYDGPPTGGGLLIGTVSTSGILAPGQYEDVTITWVNPPTAGIHTIYVVADDDGSHQGIVDECDEDNNVHWIDVDFGNLSPPTIQILDLAAASYHSLALQSNGTVLAWGSNDAASGAAYGFLGDCTSAPALKTPQPVQDAACSGPLTGIVDITAGGNMLKLGPRITPQYDHSLALDSSGIVWTWGYNGQGQLGIGSFGGSRDRPTQVSGIPPIVAVSAGDGFSLALDANGDVWSWGFNFAGQLGIGNRTNQSSPIQIAGLSNIMAISAGGAHALAQDSGGVVYQWGQYGTGRFHRSLTPVVKGGLPVIVAIQAGGGSYFATGKGLPHALALDANGQIWTWGANTAGQLGDCTGTYNISLTPVLVDQTGGGGWTASELSAGYGYSIAIDSTGQAWSWGTNGEGELGNGGTAQSYCPTAVDTSAGMGAVTVFNDRATSHTLAVNTSNEIWGWGSNRNGRLNGLASPNFSTSPLYIWP